jgi:hypothetical protein
MSTKPSALALVCIVALVQVALSRQRSEPADFVAYINQIRECGMSENAQFPLRFVAYVRLGSVQYGFEKDSLSGVYHATYPMTISIREEFPNARRSLKQDSMEHRLHLKQDSVEHRLREEETLNEWRALQPIADADSSGFVTTEEAREFSRLVDFGYKTNFVLEREGHDLERVYKGLHTTAPEFRKDLQAYRRIADKARRAHLAPLPTIDL